MNLCGAWVPLDELVYAAFGNLSEQTSWKSTILEHKNGDLRDNTFENLKPVKVNCSKSHEDNYHPVVTPNDVLNQYYPELIAKSELLRAYYSFRGRIDPKYLSSDDLTPSMVQRMESICEGVVSKMMCSFLMDGYKSGDRYFVSPFLASRVSRHPLDDPDVDIRPGVAAVPDTVIYDEVVDDAKVTKQIKGKEVCSPRQSFEDAISLYNDNRKQMFWRVTTLCDVWLKRHDDLEVLKEKDY